MDPQKFSKRQFAKQETSANREIKRLTASIEKKRKELEEALADNKIAQGYERLQQFHA